MKLGMPTLLALDNLEMHIELCKALELDFIELNMNIPMFLPQSLSPWYLKQLSVTHGIEFTLHLPEELDVASFIEPLRDAAATYVCECLDWAKASGICMVTMHLNSGIYFTLPEGKMHLNAQYYNKYIESLSLSMMQICAKSKALGVTVCIENLGNYSLKHVSDALAVLVENPEFALTWDVGHDAKSAFKDGELITKYKNKVKHMHLHDYNGISDHQVLFSGNVDLYPFIEFAKAKDLGAVIEVKTVDSLKASVAALRARLY